MQRFGLDVVTQYRRREYVNDVLKYFLRQKGVSNISKFSWLTKMLHIGLPTSDLRKEEMITKLDTFDANEVQLFFIFLSSLFGWWIDQVLLKVTPLRDDLIFSIQHKLSEYAARGRSTAATLTTYTTGKSLEERTRVNTVSESLCVVSHGN